MPRRVVEIDNGEPLPELSTIGGLGLMGGPMSVNDDLAWIAPVLRLVQKSMDAHIPVIGHCLGGQLMARAMGGQVRRNDVKEIGWGEIEPVDSPAAAKWGTPERFTSFHWHGETFSIPRGAERIWRSAHCENQAFAMGKHLAMQCHIEMTDEMIDRWCETGDAEINEALGRSPAVQTPSAMRENAREKLAALNAVADRVYARWIEGL